MSFFDTILDLGKTAVNYVTQNSLASNLLKTVVTGFAVSKINKAVKKDNEGASNAPQQSTTVDPGVRLQVPANQNIKVPVVYGSAQLGGIITEAVMSQSNTRMTYVLTICEKTGNLLSTGSASSFGFEDVYYNDQRIIFDTTGANAGIEAAYSVDRNGNRDYSIDGLVRVWCYNGSSTQGVVPDGYTNASVPAAYTVVPNWTSSMTMNDLVFAVVQVNYNKDKGVTQLPNMRFHVINSMTLPGDCLLDYMTNTRYGAGIPLTEIFDE
jgi:hypothetical protein